MKRTSLLFAAAVLTACFSPEVSTETAMGSGGTDGGTGTDMTSGPADGSSGSGDPGSDTTSVDPDTTATGSETGIDPNDAPPQFESFTVNGSTAPAEVDEGGTIALEADVTDDMGVASVEFFDGDTSLGVVDAAPFEL
ncbi:MAG: Ig-like domain-containing protein, partial [bacterium]|nr:Ig-like domain-containing protein [bacterium]